MAAAAATTISPPATTMREPHLGAQVGAVAPALGEQRLTDRGGHVAGEAGHAPGHVEAGVGRASTWTSTITGIAKVGAWYESVEAQFTSE